MLSQLLSADSYLINSHVTAVIFTGALALFLGLINFLGDHGSPVRRPFAILSCVVATWMAALGLAAAATDARMASLWASVGFSGLIFLPAASLHFSLKLIGGRRAYQRLAQIAWVASSAFFAVSMVSELVLRGVVLHPWGYSPLFGPLGVFFCIYLATALTCNAAVYWDALRSATAGSSMQRRLKLLLTGATIGILAIVDVAPMFAVPVVPVGYAAVIGFFTITTYVTWRYRLVDITPTFVGQQIADNMTEALIVFDCDGNIRVMNPAAEQLLDGPEENFLGKPLPKQAGSPLFRRCLDQLARGEAMRDVECWYEPAGEQRRLLSTTASTMRDRRGHPVAYVVILRDITGRRKAEEKIRFMAYHDDLTSLPNRMQFNESLAQMLETAGQFGR